MEEQRTTARVLVARRRPSEDAGLAPWVTALAGFLLGSLAGISIRTPEAYHSDATLLGFLGGGLAGAILGAAVSRVLGGRIGARNAAVSGGVAGFLAGTVMGLLSGTVAAAFRSAMVPGNDVLPSLYSAMAMATAGAVLLDLLWLPQPQAAVGTGVGGRFVLSASLTGALLGAFAGTVTGAFIQLASGDPGAADASTAGRALLSSWVGAATGAVVGAAAVLARRRR